MRKKSKVEVNAMVTQGVCGYHGSRHQSLKIFTSNRYRELSASDKAYGLEIELSCNWTHVNNLGIEGSNAIGALLQEVVFKDFPRDLVRWERDGSISGAECVTQCMTKEFIRNHYAQFKNLFDSYLPRFGMTPTSECGMHTNISLANFGKDEKRRLECARKLYYFINKYYGLSCHLLGRDTRVTHYCACMDRNISIARAKQLDPSDFDNDHYVCINFGHYYESRESARRIELRIVGGQKTFASFRNTMEVIFHLMNAIKTLSWADFEDIYKVFEGCNKYVLSRLEKCVNNGALARETYNAIALTADTETEYL